MSDLTGIGSLVRFMARRERVRVPVYIVLFAFLVIQTAAGSEGLYATQAERDDYAATVGTNPGLIAMVGPPYDITHVGGDVAWQMGGFGAVIVALMSMFILGRHTRAEEQSGRSELVRAAPVGRLAPAAAALAIVVVTQFMLGAATALAMIAYGLDAAGSFALGASMTGVGLAFAGVAAVAAQVSQSTGSMYGITGAALGGAYLLRAAGDVGDGTLSWLSPIGWGQSMRPFAGERWWPLLLSLAVAALLVGVAVALLRRRDEGAGILPARPGPATAGRLLGGSLGLAFRLQRGALIGWSVGLFLGGVSVGLTGRDADSLIGDSQEFNELLARAGGDIVDQYFAISILWLALVATGFAIQSALRMRGEETSGRAEPVLATALSRPRWAASHVAVAMLGTVAVLGAAGLGAGIADALNGDDASALPRLLGAALAAVPGVWVLIGLTVALFGLAPRVVAAAWGALGLSAVLSFFGPLLDLPDWVLDLSPFEHVPQLPAADFSAAPLVGLSAVAAALSVVGVAAFRRRDVPA